ncbi:YcjX family protein [Pelagibaculum spongiae]|uniref:ATPase n=1 Tax=Pelagibaculum spongiae TaxID=2080658 RepID=A0A2V1GVM5_9GAMM|nr:YcjX family protein [Pelagibaculum spongiae]PVZ67717.1 ATPase [Pelagibaculum spongiae]
MPEKSSSKTSLSSSWNRWSKSLAENALVGRRAAKKQLQRISDRRFSIGITGLSRSGKTTFITSLINQLLQGESAKLGGFAPAMDQRLLGAKIHPLDDLPLFPYQASLANLTEAHPQWPEATRGISGCLLELKLAKKDANFNPLKREYYSCWIEIRDYPGEWLLDLQLLEMSFADWSAWYAELFNRTERGQQLAKKISSLAPLASFDQSELNKLIIEFSEYLLDAKAQGFSQIFPGRFLTGDWSAATGQSDDASSQLAQADLCNFIPLTGAKSWSLEQLENAEENSWYKVCKKHYQQYVDQLVKPFYSEFFSKIDRQIILVDLIASLNGGPDKLQDTRQALSGISRSFSYGKQGKLARLFSPKIDKVLFVASKIDQLVASDHEAMRQLLAEVVQAAYRQARHQGVTPAIEAISAIRASKETINQGQAAIVGHNAQGQPIGYVHPPIPEQIPANTEQGQLVWQPFIEWKIPLLSPPAALAGQHNACLPHIRLDSLLQVIVGDKL